MSNSRKRTPNQFRKPTLTRNTLILLVATVGASTQAQGLRTIQSFGAAGNGLIDDTDAVYAALNSGEPIICKGRFLLTSTVDVWLNSNTGLFLQGTGTQHCQFILAKHQTLGSRGRVYIHGWLPTGSNRLYDQTIPQVVIRDIQLRPATDISNAPAPTTNAALVVEYPGLNSLNTGGWTSSFVTMQNISVLPANSASWAKYGLYLINVQNPSLSGVVCQGARAYFYDSGSACLVFTGDGKPVDAKLSKIWAYNSEYGVLVDGSWEGVAIDGLTAVSVRVGILARSINNDSTLLQVSHSEINAVDTPVYVSNIARVQIHDNHLNLNSTTANSTNPACIALEMQSAVTPYWMIHNNICEGFQRNVNLGLGQLRFGVTLNSAVPLSSNTTLSSISGNQFFGIDRGIFIGSSVNSVDVGCNQYIQQPDAGPLVHIVDSSPELPGGPRNFRTCTAVNLVNGNNNGR